MDQTERARPRIFDWFGKRVHLLVWDGEGPDGYDCTLLDAFEAGVFVEVVATRNITRFFPWHAVLSIELLHEQSD